MKLTSQQKERALQVASAIAAQVAVNGTIGEEKTLVQTCYTAVRLVAAMDQVLDAVESEETLIEEVLRDGVAYNKCREVIATRKEARKAEEALKAEQAQSETQTDSKPAKGGKAKPAAPPVDETVKTEE